MSVKTATNLATTKKAVKTVGVGAVTTGVAITPVSRETGREIAVRQYVREHPYTKLTRAQILKRLGYIK